MRIKVLINLLIYNRLYEINFEGEHKIINNSINMLIVNDLC